MQSISEIMEKCPTPYTGSSMTRDMILSQIISRFGKEEADNYQPESNCRTFVGWLKLGYRVKKNQKALRSVTFVDKLDEKGNVVKKIKRTVFLFYMLQVEPYDRKIKWE